MIRLEVGQRAGWERYGLDVVRNSGMALRQCRAGAVSCKECARLKTLPTAKRVPNHSIQIMDLLLRHQT